MVDSILAHQHMSSQGDDRVDRLFRDREISDGQWLPVLRIAALCHDIGHSVMSHVSENYLKYTREYRDLVREFQEKHPEKTVAPQLSEIAAYYMVLSPACRKLIALARKAAGLGELRDAPSRIANTILGVTSDARLPLIHELISGPFDCDKIDYMSRDARMCGLPSVVDFTRLVQKIRPVTLSDDQLPEAIQEQVTTGSGPHTIVALDPSGANALHEVALDRALMHDKVYKHHKVRAIEAMIAALISQLRKVSLKSAFETCLEIHDDELLRLTPEGLSDRYSPLDTDSVRVAVDVAADISQRLRNRDLFMRAFAFSSNMVGEPYRNDALAASQIAQLMRHLSNGSKRKALASQIADECANILAIAGQTHRLQPIPGNAVTPYIWLSTPSSESTHDESDDVLAGYLSRPGQVGLVPLKQVSPATRAWTDAYNNPQVGFVFCPREFVDVVRIATEVVVWKNYAISVPKDMTEFARVCTTGVDGLRAILDQNGYFLDKPKVLGPVPEEAKTVAFALTCDRGAKTLSAYVGPIAPESSHDHQSTIRPEAIRQWALQFPSNLIMPAAKVVENMEVIDRRSFIDAIGGFMETPVGSTQFGHAALVPLGSPKDGASVASYWVGDVQQYYPSLEVMSLSSALATERPIILVDDIIQHGTTVDESLSELLGVTPKQTQGVSREMPLNKQYREALKCRPLSIVTVTAFPEGVETVNSRMKELELHGEVYVWKALDRVPTIMSVLGTGAPRFEAECQRIGLQLANQEEQRALGYGNRGLLITSTYNTPTSCLTALWRDGTVDGRPWVPLFRRRGKA